MRIFRFNGGHFWVIWVKQPKLNTAPVVELSSAQVGDRAQLAGRSFVLGTIP
jgi:hypothetical protein